jgi:transcription initiation factor TFIID subunit 8
MGDAFGQGMLKTAMAHICSDVGFESTQSSSSNTLVEVMQKYIETIGHSANEHAEIAGRNKANLYDVLLALEKMSPAPVTIKDMIREISQEADRDIPFGREVPPFPIKKRKRQQYGATSSTNGEEPQQYPKHVPSFLPPQPARHTFCDTKVDAVKRVRDHKKLREEKLKLKRLVQQSLSKIHNSASTPAAQPGHAPAMAIASQDQQNPFLASALREPAPQQHYQPQRGSGVSAPSSASETAAIVDTSSISKRQVSKDDRILAGTYHDGDSD